MMSTLPEAMKPFLSDWTSETNSFFLSTDENAVLKIKQEAEEVKVMGNEYFKKNMFEEAADAYTKAIECCFRVNDPHAIDTLHVYFCNRSLTAIKLENYGLAILDADRALEYNPQSSKAYYRRGTAYAALGKLLMALKDFKASYRLNPTKNTDEKIKECYKAVRQMRFSKAISSKSSEAPSLPDSPNAGLEKPLSESIQLNTIDDGVSLGYRGPFYRKDSTFLKELIEYIKIQGNLINKRDAYRIVLDMITELKKEPTLVEIDVPQDSWITVCGDVHGQFYDLLNILEINGLPSNENPYLFNGDFVDRGSFSVECVLTLFVCKLIYPKSVFLARGNHETRNMNKLYGFQGEVIAKYDVTLYELFCECFCYLPLAHLINKKVFVVHGGLFSTDNVTLQNIAELDRNREPPEEGVMTELLWSDPQDTPGRSASKRGVACAFGPDVTEAFLKNNNLSYVIRSHEMKQNGYDCQHNKKMITVFSAPNYCDQMGNKGSFIKIYGDTLTPNYTTFDAVPHPPVPAMQYANPLLSLFG